MKKLLSVVLATLMLISVFPFALPQTVTAATTERIAYLDTLLVKISIGLL